MRLKLTYEIKDSVIVFPIQNEIENLFISLNQDYHEVYFNDLKLGNNVVIKYCDKYKSWCLQHK